MTTREHTVGTNSREVRVRADAFTAPEVFAERAPIDAGSCTTRTAVRRGSNGGRSIDLKRAEFAVVGRSKVQSGSGAPTPHLVMRVCAFGCVIDRVTRSERLSGGTCHERASSVSNGNRVDGASRDRSSGTVAKYGSDGQGRYPGKFPDGEGTPTMRTALMSARRVGLNQAEAHAPGASGAGSRSPARCPLT